MHRHSCKLGCISGLVWKQLCLISLLVMLLLCLRQAYEVYHEAVHSPQKYKSPATSSHPATTAAIAAAGDAAAEAVFAAAAAASTEAEAAAIAEQAAAAVVDATVETVAAHASPSAAAGQQAADVKTVPKGNTAAVGTAAALFQFPLSLCTMLLFCSGCFD